jgi:trimeric autotransporter adhesin
MASLRELSQLSLAVYGTVEATLPPGWRVLTNSFGEAEAAAGYFGIAYENVVTNEIVVASRGTELDIADWRSNAEAFFGKVISQFSAAKLFAQRVMGSAPNAAITFTGHSLGGGLSNMLAVALGHRAVGFNSIGVKASLVALGAEAGYDPTRDYRSTISNISSWFDPAALVDERIGADKRIAISSIPFVPDIFEPILAIVAAVKFNILGPFVLAAYQVSQHSMANMVKTLASLTDAEITEVAPDLAISATGQLSGTLVGEFGSLEQAIAQDGDLQAALVALLYEDQIALAGPDIDAEQDVSSTNPRFLSGRDGKDVVLGESGSDVVRGGASTDIVAGGRGADAIEGGTGDDFLIGGEGTDTYLFSTGHGVDRVIDSDGRGRLIRNGRPLALGIGEGTQWKFGSQTTYTKNGTDLEITFGDGADRIIIKEFNFTAAETDQYMGIRLRKEPTPPTIVGPEPAATTRDILGDREILVQTATFTAVQNPSGGYRPDFGELRIWTYSILSTNEDSSHNPVSYQVQYTLYDDIDNVVVTETPAPGWVDALRDSAGNDNIDAGGGGDVVVADRGGDDLIMGGDGNDNITDTGGNNWINAGADDDIISTPSASGNDLILGGAGIDRITDGGGTNFIDAGNGNDIVKTGNGDDRIKGGQGDDLIEDTGGRSFVEAGSGRDTVRTGGDDDWIEGGDDGDLLWGNGGRDAIYGGGTDDQTLSLEGAIGLGESGDPSSQQGDLLSGDEGNDLLVGAELADLLAGGDGGDVIVGGAGDDTVYGDGTVIFAFLDWAVQRELFVSAGGIYKVTQERFFVPEADLSTGAADVVYGGAGEDWVMAGAGDDFVDGGDHNDLLVGDAGDDVVIGGDGDDVVDGDSAAVTAAGLAGDDYVDGGAGNDKVFGESGADYLLGGEGEDELYGGDGNDVLIGGAGQDSILWGGAGKDTYVFNAGDVIGHEFINDVPAGSDDPEASVLVLSGVERSQIKFGLGSLRIDLGGDAHVHVVGFNADDPFSTRVLDSIRFDDGQAMSYDDVLEQGFDIDGTDGDDFLAGTGVVDRIDAKGGNDFVYGRAGNDTIAGGAGNDSLNGESGNDTLAGGTGDDLLNGDVGDDLYLFELGDGDDGISDSAGTNVVRFGEGITSASLVVTAILVVSEFSSWSETRIIYGDQDDSVTIRDLGAGTVATFEFAGGETLSEEEIMLRSTTGALGVRGSSQDDTFYGTNFADSAEAFDGDDTLLGKGGNDTLFGGAGADLLVGGVGNDVLYGGQGDDRYELAIGDGGDAIEDADGTNTLRFGPGIAATDVHASLVNGTGGGTYVELRYGVDDAVYIRDGMGGGIQRFEFADGTVLGLGAAMEAMLDEPFQITLPFTDAPLTLFGSRFDDRIIGGSGVNTLSGAAGNDILAGGAAADSISGGTGDDLLIGGGGEDVLQGGDGADTLQGDGGDDLLDGGAGNDSYRMFRSMGRDVVVEAAGQSSSLRLLGVGIADLAAERRGDDLYVSIRERRDGVLISGYYTGSAGSDLGAASSQTWQILDGTNVVALGDWLGTMATPAPAQSLGNLIDEYEAAARSFYASVLVQNGFTAPNAASIFTNPEDAFLKVMHQEDAQLTSHYEVRVRFATVVHPEVEGGSYELAPFGETFSSVTTVEGRNATMRHTAGSHYAPGGYSDGRFVPAGGGFFVQLGSLVVPVYGSRTYTNPATGVVEQEILGYRIYGPDSPSVSNGQVLEFTQPVQHTHVDSDTAATVYLARISAGAGDDYLGFGEGFFDIQWQGFSVVDAGAGNDTIDFSWSNPGFGWFDHAPSATVDLPGGGEVSRTGWIGSLLYGNAGDDLLFGGVDDDVLVGGTGADVMNGGAGDDRYVIFAGNGTDTVIEHSGVFRGTGGDDGLQLSNVLLADLQLSWGEVQTWSRNTVTWLDDLYDITPSSVESVHTTLTLSWGTTDSVRIVLPHLEHQAGLGLDYVRFADGTVLSMAQLIALAPPVSTVDAHQQANVLIGNEAINFLSSGAGNDTVNGEAGDDWIFGGDGDDTISGGDDDDLIHGGYGADFMSGDAGDDILGADEQDFYGVGNTYRGGAGYDFLLGSRGSDLYLFEQGDGADVVGDYHHRGGYSHERYPGVNHYLDGDYSPIFYGGTLYGRHGTAQDVFGVPPDLLETPSYTGTDTIRFGAGITAADLEFRRVSNSLALGYSDGDQVTLIDWFTSLGGRTSRIEFADGTFLDAAAIVTQANGVVLSGTAGDDTLTGTGGADTLSGHQGNDILAGGLGGDTYLFNLGDGVDRIEDVSRQADNIVRFGAGITADMLSLFQDGTIGVGAGGDAIVLAGFDSDEPYDRVVIERFVFADGSVLFFDELVDQGFVLPEIHGTAGDDSLTGTALMDRLLGHEGNDVLMGADDHDVLEGGEGDDLLQGGEGEDELYGDAGDDGLQGGADADYLEDGDGSDLLYGGDGGDALYAGDGNDLLDGGAGYDTLGHEARSFVVGGADDDWIGNYGSGGVIAYNSGDGLDDIYAAESFTLSIGGGVMPADLSVRAEGDGLILTIGENDAIRLWPEWEEDVPTWPEITLQLFGAAIHTYDFDAVIDAFYAALDADPELTELELDGLLQANQIGSSTTEALGGALAHVYATTGTLDGLSEAQIRQILADPGFGTTAQSIAPPSDNEAPEVSNAIADQSLYAHRRFQFQVPAGSFTDPDTGDTLTYSATLAGGGVLPSWLSFDANTLTFTGTPVNSDAGTVSVRVTATDGDGLWASDDFDVVIETVNVVAGTAATDILDATSSADFMSGLDGNDALYARQGDDTLDGGAGDDTLDGAEGSDTYLFGRGSGVDTAYENGGVLDVVQMGPDVLSDDVRVSRSSDLGSLVLNIRDTADQLSLAFYFDGEFRRTEEVRFADGTVWGEAELMARLGMGTDAAETMYGSDAGDTMNGHGGSDTIHGVGGDDVLLGGTGNDTLWGGLGADTLDGGAGNDSLMGQAGDDVYVLALGTQQDTLYESDATSDNFDTVMVAAGVLPSQVLVRRRNESWDNSLYLIIEGTGDQLGVANWFSNASANWIDQVEFADGTVWDVATLQAKLGEGSAAGEIMGGNEFADTMNGHGGNDTIYGYGGDDLLLGEEGNDVLRGGLGADTLEGGAGNDSLEGQAGDDVYVLALGTGSDTVYETDATSENFDTVQVAAGVLPSQVLVRRRNESWDNSLYLKIDGTSDQLAIANWFSNAAANWIDRVEFADGTVWDVATLQAKLGEGSATGEIMGGNEFADTMNGYGGNDTIYGYGGDDVLQGGNGNDTVYGGTGADTLDGGTGNDTLVGEAGDDTYVLGLGTGLDSVHESDATSGNFDTVQVAAGVLPSQVLVRRRNETWDNSLYLKIEGTDDQLGIANWFSDAAANRIDRVTFADGTIWDVATLQAKLGEGSAAGEIMGGNEFADTMDGAGGNDTIYGRGGDDALLGGEGNDTVYGGTGGDTLDGGTGNDTLIGEAGDDTYVLALGMGLDYVHESDAASGNFDTVQVAAGLLPSQVLVRRRSETWDNSLYLKIEGTTDQLGIANWFSDAAANRIDRVEFSDGTVWDVATLQAKLGEGSAAGEIMGGNEFADTMNGYGGDDTLYGYGGDDVLVGGEGNDPLWGGQGNDVLDGGAGNDGFMAGEWGNDTYVFGRGSGIDTFYENYSGTMDVVQMAAGVLSSDVKVSRSGDQSSLIFSIRDTSDQLTAAFYFNGGQFEIEEVRFADGTVWDQAEIEARVVNDASVVTATGQPLLLNQVVAAGSLFTVADAEDDPAVSYLLRDTTAGGGYFTVNGQEMASGTGFVVSAAELSNTQFVASGAVADDSLQVQVNDGTVWSAVYDFNVNSRPHLANTGPTASTPPTPTVLLLNQAVAAGSLFTVSDAEDDPAVRYLLRDTTAGGGHFTVSGQEMASGTAFIVSAAELASTQFVAAGSVGSDWLHVQVYDGMDWSAVHGFSVNSWSHPTNTAPAIDESNRTLLLNQAVAVSALIPVTDAESDPIVQYRVNDLGSGGGYFRVNGVQQAANQWIVLSPAEWANTEYVAGSSVGTEQVLVYATDGMTERQSQAITLISEDGMLSGGSGSDTLSGDANNPVVEGNGGNDTANAGNTDSLLSGNAGDDTLNGSSGDDLLVGGTGNDAVSTGSGSNVITFNAGDGFDNVFSDAMASNTLSFGGGLSYNHLSLSKNGDDLVVNTGAGEGVVLKDWYAGKDTVENLQLMLDATGDYDANSSDPLYNSKVQTFDFLGMVGEFDQALAASPGLTSWALTNALLQFHLTGADDEAIGGDLAYWYGKNGGLTGISLPAAQEVIGGTGFGADAQTLRPFSGLQDGFVKLS